MAGEARRVNKGGRGNGHPLQRTALNSSTPAAALQTRPICHLGPPAAPTPTPRHPGHLDVVVEAADLWAVLLQQVEGGVVGKVLQAGRSHRCHSMWDARRWCLRCRPSRPCSAAVNMSLPCVLACRLWRVAVPPQAAPLTSRPHSRRAHLELQQHMRLPRLERRNELRHQRLVGRPRHALLAQAAVLWVCQQLRVVGAHIQGDGKDLVRRHAGRSGVQQGFALTAAGGQPGAGRGG